MVQGCMAMKDLRWFVWVCCLLVSLSLTFCSNGTTPNTKSEEPTQGSQDGTSKERIADAGGTEAPPEAASSEAPSELAQDKGPNPHSGFPNMTSPVLLEPAMGPGKVRIQPTLAFGQDGRLAMAYTASAGNNQLGIFFTLLDTEGKTVVKEVRMDTFLSGNKNEPSICALAQGGYVVAWPMDSGIPEDQAANKNLQIRFRLVDADGKPTGTDDTRVLTKVEGNHWLARVTCTQDGGFAIAGVRPDDGKTFGVFLWRFDVHGKHVGDAQSVNQETDGNQAYPVIGAGPDGTLVVAWEQSIKTSDTTTREEVAFRVFPPAPGTPSETIIVAGGTGSTAKGPSVSVDPSSGKFLVAATIPRGAPTLKAYAKDGTSPTTLSLPDQSSSNFYHPSLTSLGKPDAHAMIYLRGSGKTVSAIVSIIGPPEVSRFYSLKTTNLPPYRPSIAAHKGRLAAAWTERGEFTGSFTIRLALFPATP